MHRKRQCVHNMFFHEFGAPLPPPNRQVMDFLLKCVLKGPQTELRTLSQNCKQTLPKLRANRIMNKWALLNADLLSTRNKSRLNTDTLILSSFFERGDLQY